MTSLEFYKTYWSYYIQLEKEFFETELYCDIDPLNQDAFSVKYMQLYLAICSEIDVVFKALCKAVDQDQIPDKMPKYIKIINDAYPTFKDESVKFLGCEYEDRIPWESLLEGESPKWWKIYNNIKHRRNDINDGKSWYKYANQINVMDALSGLLVLEEYYAAKLFATDRDEEHNSVMAKYRSAKMELIKWRFWFSFMGQPPWFDNRAYYRYIEGEQKSREE